MNIVSIEPTPNPNSMKINLDERLDPDKKYTFTKKDKGLCPVQLKDILDVDGVESIFRVADFLSVQRNPNADWEEILTRVKIIIEVVSKEEESSSLESSVRDEHFGEIQVFYQYFRNIPLLIKVTDGKEEKRYPISNRFQEAVNKASQASTNMLMERQWRRIGIRYGTIENIGKIVVEEMEAAYGDKRLESLVEGAFNYEEKKEEEKLNPQELEKQLISEDWRQRFAALHQMGADKIQRDRLVRMSKDIKMNIRRLAVVLIGLVGGKKVLEPLCDALNDEAVGVRRAAGDALTDLGDATAMGPMISTLKDQNKLIRWRAGRFLFEHGDESALMALKECQDDPEFEVRMQIRQAIERIEGGKEAQGTVWQQMTNKSNNEGNNS
jgi:hypothetical protein